MSPTNKPKLNPPTWAALLTPGYQAPIRSAYAQNKTTFLNGLISSCGETLSRWVANGGNRSPANQKLSPMLPRRRRKDENIGSPNCHISPLRDKPQQMSPY